MTVFWFVAPCSLILEMLAAYIFRAIGCIRLHSEEVLKLKATVYRHFGKIIPGVDVLKQR
jgi:hypothetical protein